LKYHNQALKTRKKTLGLQHPDAAASYYNIGLIYGNIGDYNKALEYYNKALEILEKTLGKKHPHTTNVYNNLAMIYEKLGNL